MPPDASREERSLRRASSPREGIVPNPATSLKEQVHEVTRFFHYSPRTERGYWDWIQRYLRLYRDPRRSGVEDWRHPRSLGGAEVRTFLGHLATRNQ
ncbi:MAG TPA: phage integrase N-terminal SAM-like domain-containing protein [Verrucomicrobiota bacterium]|nr:phage integrase N-terminal SAM-like domain-containing protein [Verrucomicrobiota bacterium]